MKKRRRWRREDQREREEDGGRLGLGSVCEMERSDSQGPRRKWRFQDPTTVGTEGKVRRWRKSGLGSVCEMEPGG